MTITARYPAKCSACGQDITPGQQIEWSKGQPVRHTTCGASTTSVAPTATPKRAYRPRKCVACGHVEHRNSRGYVDGDRILRSGECQSCYEERKMGY